MSANRKQRRVMLADRRREERRLGLQTTAELWRGLDIVQTAIEVGDLGAALDTIATLRTVVKMADKTLADNLARRREGNAL